jgi:hypothetical protein
VRSEAGTFESRARQGSVLSGNETDEAAALFDQFAQVPCTGRLGRRQWLGENMKVVEEDG